MVSIKPQWQAENMDTRVKMVPCVRISIFLATLFSTITILVVGDARNAYHEQASAKTL
jgi:hypothetical protein